MKLSDEVIAVLTLCETDGNRLRITTELDRPLYVAVNKVLVDAGGKWNSRASAHLFAPDVDAGQVVERLLAEGAVLTDADAQFFPTPPAVADQLIALADLEPDMDALEPSAGRGGIASRLAPWVDGLDCIELHWKYAQAIEEGDYARNLWIGDFLAFDPRPEYQRIVMNPPFTGGQDIQHVQHALRFLAPGGLLVSVMAGGIMFRDERPHNELRELVSRSGGDFERLPDEAFKQSGTGVRTVAAVIPYPVRRLAGAR